MSRRTMENTTPRRSKVAKRQTRKTIRAKGMEGETLWVDKESKQQETIKVKELRKILEDQQYRCNLTGDPLTPEKCSSDHMLPVSKGGGYGIDNIQLVLPELNRMKGALTQQEFIDICCKVTDRYRSQQRAPQTKTTRRAS